VADATATQPAGPVVSETIDAEALDARYGRRGIRRGPWVAVIAAVSLAVVTLAWFIWAQPVSQSTLEWSDLTHSIDSPEQVTTTWRLVVEPGTEVSCAINALNADYAIVGWRIIEVPASGEAVRDLTESMRTTERAGNGFVYGCWLT
jgi:hypothetical protein